MTVMGKERWLVMEGWDYRLATMGVAVPLGGAAGYETLTGGYAVRGYP